MPVRSVPSSLGSGAPLMSGYGGAKLLRYPASAGAALLAMVLAMSPSDRFGQLRTGSVEFAQVLDL